MCVFSSYAPPNLRKSWTKSFGANEATTREETKQTEWKDACSVSLCYGRRSTLKIFMDCYGGTRVRQFCIFGLTVASAFSGATSQIPSLAISGKIGCSVTNTKRHKAKTNLFFHPGCFSFVTQIKPQIILLCFSPWVSIWFLVQHESS